MSDSKIKKMVLTALLAALTCVATMIIHFPSLMDGYVNLGDCFVLLAGWLLGPWLGFAAGGIGSMLADIFLGYTHYAPGTLVIKGLVALVAALLYRVIAKKNAYVGMAVSGIVSECIMVLGYFLYAGLILGKGLMGEVGAIASVPGNCFQAAVGIIIGVIVMSILRATKADRFLLQGRRSTPKADNE